MFKNFFIFLDFPNKQIKNEKHLYRPIVVSSMVSDYDLKLLVDLTERVYEEFGENTEGNIRPLAKELGLDIDGVMQEIIKICRTEDYRVGCHMYGTRENVIPPYLKDGALELDRDHTEGLAKIIAVHLGHTKDY